MPRLDLADTSHYQEDNKPEIDFKLLRSSGVVGWMGKATQGGKYIDPDFLSNRSEAHAADFKYKGLYHFLSANIEISRQADHFLATIGELAPKEFYAIDAERDESAGKEVTEEQVFEFKSYIEVHFPGCGGTYTGDYVDEGRIWKSTRLFTPNHGRFFAAYTTEAKARKIALPFAWDMWQYSSNGPVPGVAGRCDMNQIDNFAKMDLISQPVDGAVPMEILITNSEPFNFSGTEYPINAVKWKLMPDGSIRHLSGIEYGLLTGVPFKEFAKITGEIFSFPAYTPVGLSHGTLTGSITFP